jgi:uncharacterized protein (TIGR02145 family)
MNKTFCKTSFLYTTFLALSLLFIAGCGDDGNPSAPDNENELSSSSSGLSAKSSTAMSKSSSSSKDSKKDKQDNTQEDYIVLEVEHDSITDPRDGKVYRTVQYYMEVQSGNTTVIDSFTVLTRNLNYADTIIDSATTVFDDSKVEKRCYNDDPWYCDNYFGGLYTWSEALGLPKVCDSVGVADNSKCNVKLGDDAKVQGVCPEGWHVMNETEWKDVKNTNSSGMSVLPYGDGTYDSQNSMFWMAHEFKEKPKMGGAFMINGFSTSSASSKYGFLYVRCVMDEGDTFIQ